jgi:hypothetical protein
MKDLISKRIIFLYIVGGLISGIIYLLIKKLMERRKT